MFRLSLMVWIGHPKTEGKLWKRGADGRGAACGVHSADGQRRQHLVEAASFGRLDHMVKDCRSALRLGWIYLPAKYQGV